MIEDEQELGEIIERLVVVSERGTMMLTRDGCIGCGWLKPPVLRDRHVYRSSRRGGEAIRISKAAFSVNVQSTISRGIAFPRSSRLRARRTML